MGIVYKALQKSLDRVVALKRIVQDGHAGAAERERFHNEAQVIARLRHPHVVQVYEVGEAEGLPYFSMEYCPDGSLGRDGGGTGGAFSGKIVAAVPAGR
jgi:serine/threonine-protein kinase